MAGPRPVPIAPVPSQPQGSTARVEGPANRAYHEGTRVGLPSISDVEGSNAAPGWISLRWDGSD